MQEQQLAPLEFLDVLVLLTDSCLVLLVKLVEIDLDGFVGMSSMFGRAEGANK
jgi:hypothetical protein